MENSALLILLESVLGKGQSTSKGNYAFKCPFCNHHKFKLEVNIKTNEKKENHWNCWTCPTSNPSKGKTIKSLFKKLKVQPQKFEELGYIIQPGTKIIHHYDEVSIPLEFKKISNPGKLNKLENIEYKHALKFLNSRNITIEDTIKYNIGFCTDGKYAGRIIIPSYDSNGILNYYIARSYTESGRKYKNPIIPVKDIIGWELYINWDVPIILVEGIFDALTIKRNVIPLFGKVIHDKLMEKIVSSSVQKIYIALDKDVKREALKYCEKLMSYGKKVYFVELDEGKDFSEMGFEKSLDILENTYPVTFQTLMEKKLELL